MDESALTELEQQIPADAKLYNPTVQSLEQSQKKGYYPVEKMPEGADLQWLNNPERQYDSKDWLGRFSTAFKNTWGDFINSAQRNNVTVGATKINWGKSKEEVEFGRQMAVEALKNLERLEEGREELSPKELETWAAGFGSGGASILQFAILTGAANAGLGSLAAQAAAGYATTQDVYKNATLEDIQKYIDETGDTELRDFGSQRDSIINMANAVTQGLIETGLNGVGRVIFHNPAAKKIAGNLIEKGERYFSSNLLGRALLTAADESLTNMAEEGGQQVSDNIAAILKDNKDLTWNNIMEGTGKSMIIGGVYGGAQAAALHNYGHRATRNYIEEKLIQGAQERGIEVGADEIRTAAEDLTNVIESRGIQTVSDNTKKILDVTDSESDLAQTLAKAFQALVDKGQVRIRGITPEQTLQLGLDWANYMQATAILDSIDRGIPLTTHPLFNAVAEADRIFLEGRDFTEGDLLGIDINNPQLQYIANEIQDFIEARGESRAAEEQARQIALREADLVAQKAQWDELERLAREEVAKEEAAKNETALETALQQLAQIQERIAALEAQQVALTAERQNIGQTDIKAPKAYQANQDRIAAWRTRLKQNNKTIDPNIREKQPALPKDIVVPTELGKKASFQHLNQTFDITRTQGGYNVELKRNGKTVASMEVKDNGYVDYTQAEIEGAGFALELVLATEGLLEPIVGPFNLTIVPGNTNAEDLWFGLGYTNSVGPNRFTRAITNNSGTFSREDDRFMYQGKKTSKSTRGKDDYRGAYDPLTRAIIFSKISDVSTLFHETAHYWFDRNLRYYRTGLASPEWKKHWEEVMEELGLKPNKRGGYSLQAIKDASEKFARQQEAYLKDGQAKNSAMEWAHQDYGQMVGRVYRNLWTQYYGLDGLTPAVKAWFDMNGYDVNNVAASIEATEADSMTAQENTIGNIVANDETQPSQDIPGTDMKLPATEQVVKNPYTDKSAIVPKDPFEIQDKSKSKLPKAAERATGVKTEDVTYNRRSMSESLEAASKLVAEDEAAAWDILKSPNDRVDGLYKGDVYRALINKYRAENNPVKIRQVVNAFAESAREAGRAVKAFDLNDRPISYENAVDTISQAFNRKRAKAQVNDIVKELKATIHDKAAVAEAWKKFKEEVGCK